MNLDDLFRQIDPDTRMLILCSPHNPGGRVWSRDELARLSDLCLDHDILIVSDEVHHDLVFDAYVHTVLASLGSEVSSRVITCTSASKTFNLAGTMTGNVIISNDTLRRRFRKHLARCGIHGPNGFGVLAATAAYNHGEEWLEELLVYLQGNQRRIREVLELRLPEVVSMPLEGTYLAWLDFTATGLEIQEVIRRIQEKAGLALSHGYTFGPGGENYMRLNFACPRSMLDEALDRLVNAFS
jgi:cystathionine beta-lyase